MHTYGRYPVGICKGSGASLFDVNGKEYLDFAAGIATCCLGEFTEQRIKAYILSATL